jgi:serine/threonine-protein kinase HipA
MSAPDKRLVVLLGGQQIGSVTEDRDRLTFSYEEGYRSGLQATPLSLSMPLLVDRHGDEVVRPFLWGLLPDNEQVLERWARRYQVSPRNPFALLRHVGADCAGAAQFVPPDEAEGLLAGKGAVEWIDEAEIGRRLRTLRRDPTAWHLSSTGQFSLAGAQAKTALHFDPDARRWGNPQGAVPTTHIIKPAVIGFDDHDLNEHICLQAALELGYEAASSEMVSFDGERAIVVERYDRLRSPDGSVQRIHQEDMCQALGVPPTAKYQNEGGPSPERIWSFLQAQAGPVSGMVAGARFLEALTFNWIVAGTDAHAKNYSVLLSGGQVRLTPMYDVASALPYDDMYLPKLKMAMRIGGEYVISKVGRRHWERFAESVGLRPEATVTYVARIASMVPDAFATAVSSEPIKALQSELPGRLLDRVASRAKACQAALSRQ